MTGSKKYKPDDVKYSVNGFDILAWEIKTPSSKKLDVTLNKLAMQLKHMLQRLINAGLNDIAVFGVIIKGNNSTRVISNSSTH